MSDVVGDRIGMLEEQLKRSTDETKHLAENLERTVEDRDRLMGDLQQSSETVALLARTVVDLTSALERSNREREQLKKKLTSKKQARLHAIDVGERVVAYLQSMTIQEEDHGGHIHESHRRGA